MRMLWVLPGIHVAMDRHPWKSPLQNPVVLVMRADPNPIKIIAPASHQGAIGAADAHRRVGTGFFEAKRRMIGVERKQRVLFVSLFLNIRRQRVVTVPELRQGMRT